MTTLKYFNVNQNNLTLDIDVRVIKEWTFLGSVKPLIYIAMYLTFVLKIGPKIMNMRNPFTLKHTLIVYNAMQTIFSLYLCYKASMAYFSKHSYDLSNYYEQKLYNIKISEFSWLYLVAKLSEFFDTIFFVLRKKENQITFLHVYHHSYMVFLSWFLLNTTPENEVIAAGGFINSFVHVVMYTYYLIAALGPEYQKYIWWKKYLTILQLVQFCTIIVYLGYVILFTNIDSLAAWMMSISALIFFGLFMDFYRKQYKIKSC